MGVYTMRCGCKLLITLMALATAGVMAFAQSRTYNLGTSAPPEEIKALDHVVGPSGKELPPGSGTAKEGAKIFAERCQACHGANGAGGSAARLVATDPTKFTQKSATNYYPYATIAWDLINRAMPANKPGSLSPDEVYAVTAYLLFKNGIIQETDSMDAKTLPKVQMPNRNGFVPAVPVWPAPPKPSWY
jgi:mono/diheme cytochrome c family protein